MITTPGPEFVKNNDQSGARSGDHTHPYIGAIGNIYNELASQGMTSAQAAQFIRDAITVYCPDQKGS
jgi:hypothetical protein